MSQTGAVLLIIGGIIGLMLLLRALDVSAGHAARAELKRARRDLKAVAAMIEQRRRDRTADVTPDELRQAIESIAGCTRILRRTATDSHARALASIERTAVLLSSAMDSTPPLQEQRQRNARKTQRL